MFWGALNLPWNFQLYLCAMCLIFNRKAKRVDQTSFFNKTLCNFCFYVEYTRKAINYIVQFIPIQKALFIAICLFICIRLLFNVIRVKDCGLNEGRQLYLYKLILWFNKLLTFNMVFYRYVYSILWFIISLVRKR